MPPFDSSRPCRSDKCGAAPVTLLSAICVQPDDEHLRFFWLGDDDFDRAKPAINVRRR